MIDLGLGVQADAEDLFHEAGGRLLEGGNAVVGVAAVFKLVDLALGCLADEGIGHVVVFADAEIQELPLWVGGQHRALGPLDLLELVNLAALAVIDAAQTLGEEGLKPGVRLRCGHGCRQLSMVEQQ